VRTFDPFDEEYVDTLDQDGETPEYVPQFWRPAKEIDALVPGRDGVPTIDDDLDHDPDAAPRSYSAWTDESSVVLSGPCGDWAKEHPTEVGYCNREGTWYRSRFQARVVEGERHGPILESYRLPNRWCFRFNRPGHAQGVPAHEG
jgi:hypothetical protein